MKTRVEQYLALQAKADRLRKAADKMPRKSNREEFFYLAYIRAADRIERDADDLIDEEMGYVLAKVRADKSN